MIGQIPLPSGGPAGPPASVADRRRRLGLAGGLVVALTVALALWFTMPRAPGDDSVEAGFARAMIVHHEQAVAMALLIRDRTSDPTIKALATDILLTQQNQIGQMLGWLNVWGLRATGTQPPMAWMAQPPSDATSNAATPGSMGTMPTMGDPAPAGMMPGMATPEEMAHLATLSDDAADTEFLRLMIRHHRGAIPMAEAALGRSQTVVVRALAGAILVAQEAEVAAMEVLLERESRSGAQP